MRYRKQMAAIEVLDTDITALDVDAIANAANTRLIHGGGVAGAISRAGGPAIQAESDAKAPIGLGEAVETSGGDMPSRWVIHAATMELGGPTSAEIIRRATAATLDKADELGARSLALVAFGTGVGGFPLDEAAADRGRGGPAPPRRRLAARARRVRRPRRGGARGVRGRARLSDLLAEVTALGGAAAPASATARLREVLLAALKRGTAELGKPRSGYDAPVEVAIAAAAGDAARRHPGARRAPRRPRGGRRARVAARRRRHRRARRPRGAAAAEGPGDLRLAAGDLGGFLLLALPGRRPRRPRGARAARVRRARGGIDRLRARAAAVPARLFEGPELRRADRRPPSAARRRGGRAARRPARGPASVEEHEDAVLALLQPVGARAVRPHEDPDPARRVARRILQRLDGMGKWGGYHTDFAHLARGFAGNERALAQDGGEALLEAGLLAEKPSVGQRHVFLNPRRAAEIRRLIDDGELPSGMRLPSA